MSHTANGLHHIGVAKNGVDIYVNLIRSDAAEHISHRPQILTLAKQLLATKNMTGQTLELEHDFGHVIGNSEVVETTAKDTIVYAKRLKHDTFSRFVRKRQLTPSSFLSMSMRKVSDGYEIVDVWIGRLTPPSPADESATPASKSYWENHAIVFEGQALQLRTLTKEAPY